MAKARILIVEDESVVAKDIQIRLKGLGYAVCAIASSGEGAIQKAAETHPDLILMDIVLKGDMDGIEAASQIRSRLNIPVLYLTAYTDERTLQRAKITEPFAYIIKPFQERELHSNIEMALYKHKVERERKKMEEALRKAHDELERRVEERTAELSKSNALLKQEIAERKRTEEALQRSERELRRLSSQLLKVQEEERKRVALELHDGIGQSLSAIKFRVEAALEQMGREKPAKGVKSLEPIVPMVQEAVEEVRRITINLRPSTLDDLGILPTIEWFCREFHTIYSDIRIEKEINIQEQDVPDPLKIVIFRVLQEAFNNIGKHSQANLLHLSLGKKDGGLELAVKDNGLGFDLEDVLSGEGSKGGLGLTSMKERTELSGGFFAMESTRGAGTMIRSSWPLRI